MLDYIFDAENSILYVQPKSLLSEADFERLSQAVDPYILAGGILRGIIIEVSEFPGWEDFEALAAHFRFVRDHHRYVRRVALVTDSALGTVAETLSWHFVSAEIRKFGSEDLEAARLWMLSSS